jgi:putative serine protease PepD
VEETTMLRRVLAPAAALLAAGAIGGLAAVAGWEAVDAETTTTVREAAEGEQRPIASSGTSIADVVDEAMSSVVEIRVEGGGGIDVPELEDSPFPLPERQAVSTGSGWVFDDQGHVVTNQHVVGDAETATVVFSDGEEVDARVVGTDPSTDVAVLELAERADVEPLPRGQTSSLRIGDTVIAIGSPFGLSGTVTSGIVSALDRDITAPDGFTIDGAIQTDAALNSGNSGGPLLDASGRVVGMNSQIASESGGNDGVGYAVPIEAVVSVASELLADGEVEHAYLGVQIGDAEDGGAQVADVVQGGPADDAGLRAGDVIVRANGEEIADGDALRAAVAESEPGDELELQVRRGDETETITVELGTRPSSTD